MASKGPSPEEQLLNLIEKRGEGHAPKAKKRKKVPLFFFRLLNQLSFKGIGRLGKVKKKKKLTLSIGTANKVLIVACILMIGFSILDFFINRKDIVQFYDAISGRIQKEQKQGEISKLKPFLHYLALVQRRNIFSPITQVVRIDEVKEKKKALQDFLADLVLVGISWGAEPQAMIENKKVNQTYFLSAGEVINNLRIEAILENKVIVSYEGEKGELI